MADSRNEQFFHGTDRRFSPGDELDAGSWGQSYPDKSYRPGVYMSNTHARARKWAADVAKNRGSNVGHVYEVEPHGQLQINRLPFGEGTEHIAESATVKSHVSATEVLNPGYEDMGFGSAPAKMGKTYKGKRLAEFMNGGAPKEKVSGPKAPAQLKGQGSLFGTGKVIDNAPEANRRLHERDMAVGQHQPSIHEDQRAGEIERVAGLQADGMKMKSKVRQAMGRDNDPTGAIRRAKAMMRDHPVGATGSWSPRQY